MLVAATSFSSLALGQRPPTHREVLQLVDQHAAHFSEVSRTIWEYAELGYQEQKSSALLQRELQSAGFRVQSGADEPTAFVAVYGQGEPVIGILGEFDALPGLSQTATPDRQAVVADGPGHGCGHNLLGSGAALAAVALKEYMEQNHVPGTLRYFGTPAEEGGDGKVYMIRAGLFRDVDVVLHRHPFDENSVFNGGLFDRRSGARSRTKIEQIGISVKLLGALTQHRTSGGSIGPHLAIAHWMAIGEQ